MPDNVILIECSTVNNMLLIEHSKSKKLNGYNFKAVSIT